MRQARSVFRPKFALTVTLAALLVACGGGEDEPNAVVTPTNPATPVPTPEASAEGVYGGSLSGAGDNNTFLALVLENGALWSLYGYKSPSGVLSMTGFVQGSGTSSNGQYNVPDAVNISASPSPAGKLESSYDAAQKSIKGTFTFGSTVWTVDGQSLADGYDYSAPAVQSDVTGSWTMTTLAGETLTFNVSANGTLYGASGNYCAVGGKLEPRVSNKNVYDFSLAFNVSTNCNRSGQGFYGVAVSFNLPNGQRQLIVAGNDGAERGKGLAAVGTR